MPEEIDFIEHMQKLEVKDGDVLIFKSKTRLGSDDRANIKKMMQSIIDKIDADIIAMVLEEECDIGILRKDTRRGCQIRWCKDIDDGLCLREGSCRHLAVKEAKCELSA